MKHSLLIYTLLMATSCGYAESTSTDVNFDEEACRRACEQRLVEQKEMIIKLEENLDKTNEELRNQRAKADEAIEYQNQRIKEREALNLRKKEQLEKLLLDKH